MFKDFENEIRNTCEKTMKHFNLDLTDVRWNVTKQASNGQKVIEGRDYVRYVIRFKNSEYGVSIIKNYGSYGYDDDLWEIGVMKNDEFYDRLHRDFNLGDDVIGWLTDEEVKEWIEKFYSLYVLKEPKAVIRSEIARLQDELYVLTYDASSIVDRLNKVKEDLKTLSSNFIEEALH